MNEKRYARITPQAVMTDFPIGTIINWGSKGYLAHRTFDRVDGYVYDGDYWYPAKATCDGWWEYFCNDEDNETYDPPQNSDADLMWMKGIM